MAERTQPPQKNNQLILNPAKQPPVQLLPTNHRYPDMDTMMNAVKLAATEDKPILLDYWTSSIDRTAALGVKTSSGEKLLLKSKDEYTSSVSNIFKCGNDIIVVTENSIYLVDGAIPKKQFNN
jgi:hypothetical protein